MKKIFLVLSLSLCFAVPSANAQSVLSSLIGKAPISNPINNNTLASAISAWGLADSAIIAYRALPRCTVTSNFSITNLCYKRSILVKAQAYDLAAKTAINSAVTWKASNPTLDATALIGAATNAVTDFQNFLSASQVPGV